jgi:hypothetical protein
MPLTTTLGLFIMLSSTPNVNSGSLGAGYTLHTIKDFPGQSGAADKASADGVGNNGAIVGGTTQGSQYYGYVREAGNEITEFQAPGNGTTAFGIDRNGTVVGNFDTPSHLGEGFIRLPDGSISTLAYPGSTATSLIGINENGSEIVGSYYDSQSVAHGLIDRSGKLITYNVPNSIKPLETYIGAVNDRRDMVGDYLNDTGYHGWSKIGGVFTTIDFPGASSTLINGISNSGAMVGQYMDGGIVVHGFMLAGGVFHEIDVTGANNTVVNGINDDGELVGIYYINNIRHAFFAKPD